MPQCPHGGSRDPVFMTVLSARELLAACERVLGPVTLVTDRSWQHGEHHVIEVSDSAGQRWIAKSVRERGSYEREIHALRNWAPALDGAAPALRACDDAWQLLIMTRLPGRLAEETEAELDPAVHKLAGQLIRQLHEAVPPETDRDVAAAMAGKLELWIGRGSGLLSDAEISFGRQQVKPLTAVGPVSTLPCHLDNQPRNWLVDDDGRVSLIDFGMCRRDVWIRDMARLYVQQWAGRPDLRDAFYAGYDRIPAAADLVLLRCYLAYSAISTVVWAREHGDALFEEQGRRTLARLRAGDCYTS